jgi:hypothetical protein
MSQMQLNLPENVHRAMCRLARRHGLPPDQFVVRTLSEMAEADRALEELRARAKKGSLKHFRRVLASVPDAPPMPGDELPPGFKLPAKLRKILGRNGK